MNILGWFEIKLKHTKKFPNNICIKNKFYEGPKEKAQEKK